MPSNLWGPNEPDAAVRSEEAWLQGALVATIAYGVLFVLFCQCFCLLLKQTTRSNYNAKFPYLVIVFMIFVFGTLFTGSNMHSTQLAFIKNRNYPGGPSVYKADSPADSVGDVATILSQWLCDALLIWRYMMIYKGCTVPTWFIATLPVLVYLGSFVTGVLFLLQLSAASPFKHTHLNWLIPYISISLGLNVLITIAIVTRLMLFRHRISSALGPAHGSQYTSIAAMVIESASLYSLISILVLVPFALNSTITPAFLQSLVEVQGCATLLIVIRVASGKAWSSDTNRTLASIEGSPHSRFRGPMSTFQAAIDPRFGLAASASTVDSCRSGPLASANFKNASAIVGGLNGTPGGTNDTDTHSLDLDVDSAKEPWDRA